MPQINSVPLTFSNPGDVQRLIGREHCHLSAIVWVTKPDRHLNSQHIPRRLESQVRRFTIGLYNVHQRENKYQIKQMRVRVRLGSWSAIGRPLGLNEGCGVTSSWYRAVLQLPFIR